MEKILRYFAGICFVAKMGITFVYFRRTHYRGWDRFNDS